jgi:hypothetical protein
MSAPLTLEINRPIYLLGDHHGYMGNVFDAITKRSVRDAVILHVGDGEEGVSFGPRQFEELNEKFAKLNLLFLGIRGNHCDPKLFDGSIDLPNFKLLPDYTRLSVNGKTWLLIGGAISIDRIERLPGMDWWEEEEFQLRPDLLAPADVLVTHSGPSWIGPQTSNGIVRMFADRESKFNTDLIAQLDEERKLHEEAFAIVRPKRWYLGHFHICQSLVHEGCTTRILRICELLKHTD